MTIVIVATQGLEQSLGGGAVSELGQRRLTHAAVFACNLLWQIAMNVLLKQTCWEPRNGSVPLNRSRPRSTVPG